MYRRHRLLQVIPGPYPLLVERTPYSVAPYGEDRYPAQLGPSDEFENSGYIFVYQDAARALDE
ncbi:MAG: hypothetical protein WDM87_15675 [Terracidiphilus sp.]